MRYAPACSRAFAFALSMLAGATARADAAQEPAHAAADTFDEAPPLDSTRLFVMPTAKTLEPGHGYVVGHEGFIPSFQVGVTPHFSVGGGSFFGLVNWVTPKVQVYNGAGNSVAVALLHFMVPGYGSLGLAYGAVTHTTRRGAWTIGAGQFYASVDDDWRWSEGASLIIVGGERRISPRTTFVTENYAGLERRRGTYHPNVALLMDGIRLERRQGRLLIDLGVLLFPAYGVPSPFLNWTVKF